MKFARVFRGYAPKEVDAYLNSQKTKNDGVLSAQRQRLNELADENYMLRQTVSQYKEKEQAISDSLVKTQQLAEKTRCDAEKYAEATVLRAKVFYAAWQTYAKTLVNTLSDDEVKQFNSILKKFEREIDSFDGRSVRDFVASGSAESTNIAQSADTSRCKNPLEKVEKLIMPKTSSKSTPTPIIDLDELTNPTESLEELCKTLGIK